MNFINLKARAKINLTLDVLNKRDDGYHNLQMIMQTISLYDGVYIEKINKNFVKLKSNISWLPTDEKNLAYKAAIFLKEKFKLKEGIFIELDKKIPVAAGLAGGSSDCAAVLVGINKIFNLHLSKRKLMEYGLNFGSDVPYCIMRGTALAEGRGEILKKLNPCPHMWIVVVKPPISVSTAYIFKNLDLSKINKRPNTKEFINYINDKDYINICKNLCNVLETVTIPMHTIIGDIKELLINNGADGALMSGSGPSVFGFFQDKDKAYIAAENIRNELNFRSIYVAETFNYIK